MYNISFYIQVPDDFQYYGKYLAQPEVRKAIHVGNLTFNDGDKVEQHLQNDILQTITPWLAEVMENYKVSNKVVTFHDVYPSDVLVNFFFRM